jgi:hypothetical protein
MAGVIKGLTASGLWAGTGLQKMPIAIDSSKVRRVLRRCVEPREVDAVLPILLIKVIVNSI